MDDFLLAACGAAFVYQLAALAAAWRHRRRGDPQPGYSPPVSILKPVRGLDPHFDEAIRSHAALDYPEYEVLFGVESEDDPAAAAIRRLMGACPEAPFRLVACPTEAPNRKAGVLEKLAREAKHPVLVINDSDVRVEPDYLRRVVAPLQDPGTGVVTCLYRGRADSAPGRWEALGVATDFAPSVLVAQLVGVREFGLGSTLAVRARDLERIGGFAAISEYIADDYQLARRITEAGFRVHLSSLVVETTLGAESWRQVWRHQVRWHRTIRVSKGPAYLGILVTQATFWALLAAAAGWWVPTGLTMAARLAAGLATGVGILRCPVTRRWWWLTPLRDLFGLAVWAAGLAGSTVEWRDRRLRLSRDGRITAIEEQPGRPAL